MAAVRMSAGKTGIVHCHQELSSPLMPLVRRSSEKKSSSASAPALASERLRSAFILERCRWPRNFTSLRCCTRSLAQPRKALCCAVSARMLRTYR